MRGRPDGRPFFMEPLKLETTLFSILIKLAGAAMGSVLSLSVLRPRDIPDAFFRFMTGLITGFISGPLLKAKFHPYLLPTEGVDILLAYLAGSAFVAYFFLSAISGTISKWSSVADILRTVKEINEAKNGNN